MASTSQTSNNKKHNKLVTVSAPGKVLLAGGYLVLEHPHVGLVLAVDRRFYATIETTETAEVDDGSSAATKPAKAAEAAEGGGGRKKENGSPPPLFCAITVRSPQFRREWRYSYDRTTGRLLLADCPTTAGDASGSGDDKDTAPPKQERNAFLEKTLRVALLYVLPPPPKKDGGRSGGSGSGSGSAEDDGGRAGSGSGSGSDAGVRLTLCADNDYYSLLPHLNERGLDRSLESVASLPPFLPTITTAATNKKGDDGTDTQQQKQVLLKTGLGSSACLVTSACAALCHTYKFAPTATDDDDDDDDDQRRQQQQLGVVHNLAQLAHCHAQGKVGSGFDVSAACFGSHVYSRISPASSPMKGLLEALDDDDDSAASVRDLAAQIRDFVESPSTAGAGGGGVQRPVVLPPFLQLMLADVAGGSESPSMARRVLEWKRTATAADDDLSLWTDLAETNERIVDRLAKVTAATSSSAAGADESTLRRLASVPAEQWNDLDTTTAGDDGAGNAASDLARNLSELRQALLESRRLLKSLGDAVGIPIEPDVQTRLADATCAIPGVVAAVVPGAGGYDALACLYLNVPGVRSAVAALWANWEDDVGGDATATDGSTTTAMQVCPLSARGISYGDGLRIEPQEPVQWE